MLYIYTLHHGKIKNKKIISRVIYITHDLNSSYGTLYISHLSNGLIISILFSKKNYFDLCPTSPIVFLCCCVKGTWVKELKKVYQKKELKKETATEESISSVEEKFRRCSPLKFQKRCQECIYPIWKMARAGMNWIFFLYFKSR